MVSLRIIIIHLHLSFMHIATANTAVTIGLQESQYTVSDSDDYQFLCAEVRTGDVDGRDIEIKYIVKDSGNNNLMENACPSKFTNFVVFS